MDGSVSALILAGILTYSLTIVTANQQAAPYLKVTSMEQNGNILTVAIQHSDDIYVEWYYIYPNKFEAWGTDEYYSSSIIRATEEYFLWERTQTERGHDGILATNTSLLYNGQEINGNGLSIKLSITSKNLKTSYVFDKYNWMGTYDYDWSQWLDYMPVILNEPTDKVEFEEGGEASMSVEMSGIRTPSLVRWSFWDGSGSRQDQPPVYRNPLDNGPWSNNNDQEAPLQGVNVTMQYDYISPSEDPAQPQPSVDSTTELTISGADAGTHTGQYTLLLSFSSVYIFHVVDARPLGEPSTFPARGLELEVSSSNYQYISRDNRRLELMRGRQNSIICKASGMLVGSIEIKHDGRIMNNVVTHYGGEKAVAMVTFTDITDDDAGLYECRARAPGGVFVNRIFDVDVTVPVLVAVQEHGTAGDVMSVTCRASGEPLPEITIMKTSHGGAADIDITSQADIEDNEDATERVATFTLDAVQDPEEYDRIQCEAANQHFTKTAYWNIPGAPIIMY